MKRSGTPNQLLDVLLHTIAMSGLSWVRTELDPLLIVPSLTHHPVQTNSQSPRHGDLGGFPSPSHRQVKVFTAPLGQAAHCDSAGIVTVLHRFHFGKDGGYPVAPVIRDAAGNLYGTTQQGGDYEHIGYVYAGGVVFKIKP
jgi:hypothetical protein